MHQHLKSKKALREFINGKNTYNQTETIARQNLQASVTRLEDMMEPFIPKKLVENLLKEVIKSHD
jgi:hypothetical protein